VKSNFEASHRTCNITIEFDECKKVVIFEFKVSKAFDQLASDACMGLKEILETEYTLIGQYAGWECLAIGVSFYKKQMSHLKCTKLSLRCNNLHK
jgi:hypothetical protein